VLAQFKHSYRSLAQAQKTSRGTPLYTLLVNRPAGRALAAISPKWITPDHLTSVSGILSIGAIAVLALLAVSGPIVALVPLLLLAGYAFDSADGQLARLRGGGSLRGEWLDHILDCGKTVLLHLGTYWFLVRTQTAAPGLALLIAGSFLLASMMIFFAGILFQQLERSVASPIIPRSSRSGRLRAMFMLPADNGILCLSYVLLFWNDLFLWSYTLLAIANLTFMAAFLITWSKRLQTLDASR